jgi:hypothetical protein
MRPVAHIVTSIAAWVSALAAASAQPAPTFETTCGELRAEMKKLGPVDDLTVIAVRGRLTLADHSGPLAYMSVCSAPDPKILCVTYGLSGHVVGDDVVLTGSLARVGPDNIMLDPCLNSSPEEAQQPG